MGLVVWLVDMLVMLYLLVDYFGGFEGFDLFLFEFQIVEEEYFGMF